MTTLASGSSVTFGLAVDQTFEMTFADGTTGTITVTGPLGSPYRTTFGPAKKNNWTPLPLGATGRVVVACTAGSVSYVLGASALGGSVAGTSPDFSAAVNTAAIQAALNAGGIVSLATPGVYSLSATVPLVVKSKTSIRCGVGVSFLGETGRIVPLIKNQYCGCLMAGTGLVRASNVVTVAEAGHTKAVGDRVFISAASTSGTDSTFLGLVTVTSVVAATSWTYASAGSAGNAGAATIFYSLIPVRQTLDGANFVATALYVTVTEAGHDKKPGMNVWIGKAGGDNFAPGVVQVTRVSASTWTYKTAAATGTASGTFALSYDYDIEIDGGVWDGNRANQGSPAHGLDLNINTAQFGVVTGLRINAGFGGSSIRGLNAFNCAQVFLDKRWQGFDNLVGAQFEGGAQGVVVDQSLQTDAAIHTAAAQQTDDAIAFTGVAVVGGGGNYDSTASPYGLTFFSGIEIRRLMVTATLNGVKMATTGASCPFVGTVRIGHLFGRLRDNGQSNGPNYGVCIFDDGPGLVGTTFENIQIDGPLEWVSSNADAEAAALFMSGAGSGGSVYMRGMIAETGGMLASVYMGGMTVKLLDIDASKIVPLGTNNYSINLTGGTLRKLKVRNSRIQAGTAQAAVLLLGTAVNHIEIESNQLSGATAGTGDIVQIANATSFAALKTLSFKGNRTEEGGNALAGLFVITDVAGSTTDVYIDDHDVTSASGIRTSGTGATGTFNVYLGAKVKWTATGGNNFFQVGGCTWNVYASAGNNASIPANKKFLTGYGTPTYKCVGPLSQALTSGTAPAWDVGMGNVATLATGANATVTLGAPSNVPPAGTPCPITITQDGVGGRTVAWNAVYIFSGGAFSNTGNTANKKTTVNFVSDGTALVANGLNTWY